MGKTRLHRGVVPGNVKDKWVNRRVETSHLLDALTGDVGTYLLTYLFPYTNSTYYSRVRLFSKPYPHLRSSTQDDLNLLTCPFGV